MLLLKTNQNSRNFCFPCEEEEEEALYSVMKLSARPVIKTRPTQTLPKLSPAVLLCPDLIVRKVAVRFFGDEHAKSTGVLLIVSEEQGGPSETERGIPNRCSCFTV